MFAAKDECRFRLPQRRKMTCAKLLVDGEIIDDTQSLLEAWSRHFRDLAKSRKCECPELHTLEEHCEKSSHPTMSPSV